MKPIHKIVFIHNLNDFSGSSKILSIVINAFVGKYDIDLITNMGTGFLSNIRSVRYINNYYWWYNGNKLKTSIRLLITQIFLFFRILCYKRKNTVFYINTVMPFAAALACKISKKTMIYHVHENMNLDKSLYHLYRMVYQWTNTKTLFVSEYLKEITRGARNNKVIYNCLDDDFIIEKNNYLNSIYKTERETILMVSSLRRYKGVDEFVELATMLPQYRFELVVSAKRKDIKEYFSDTVLPENLNFFPLQTNLHPFYQKAKLLLQLSHTSENGRSKGFDPWVETFGLTILEAISYGIPSIVPNEGGPVELIDDGVSGYIVNPLDLDNIRNEIVALMEDEALYREFVENAFEKSKKFNMQATVKSIEEYIFQ